MDEFTKQARAWLDQRFRLNGDRPYQPHSDNSDFGRGRPGFLSNLGQICVIATALSRMEFDSLLDVGAADGFNAAMFRRLCNRTTAASDLSGEALCRARERFGLPGVAADSHRLPFKTGAFDVVICSETIEHLSEPTQALLELYRVSGKFVVISTLEFEPKGYWRDYRTRLLNPSYIHSHRTVFARSDFERLFPGSEFRPQLQDVEQASPFDISDRGLSLEEAKRKVLDMSSPMGFGYRKYGVLVMIKKGGAQWAPAGRVAPQAIVDALFEKIPGPTATSPLSEQWAGRLACPTCDSTPDGSDLVPRGSDLICESCQRAYRVEDGVPRLYPQQTRTLADMTPPEFGARYPGIDRGQALALRSKLQSLRRTSNRYERVVLRLGRAALHLAGDPLAFTRFQMHKLQSRRPGS